MKVPEGIHTSAVLSGDGIYRYTLAREWIPWYRKAHVLWIMLNPSTADADTDDRTIRRCCDFARHWGYGGITVVNLYALRATDPKVMLAHPRPIGPDNDHIIAHLLRAPHTGLVVAAWGEHGRRRNRYADVVRMAETAERDLYALDITKDNQPRHPLYLPGDAVPFVWRKHSEG